MRRRLREVEGIGVPAEKNPQECTCMALRHCAQALQQRERSEKALPVHHVDRSCMAVMDRQFGANEGSGPRMPLAAGGDSEAGKSRRSSA